MPNTAAHTDPRTTRFVAPVPDADADPTGALPANGGQAGVATQEPELVDAPAGLWRSAWLTMRRRPLFWVSLALIVFSLTIAAFPGLFTTIDPSAGNLRDSLAGGRSGHPFGFTQQGYDVYSRVIYGARASVITGIGVTVLVTIFGVLIGALAGFFGGWIDAILSRLTDIFFAIPLILAGIVLMQLFTHRTIGSVILVLAAFGWPQMARVVRGAVLTVKHEEYVTASRALGLSKLGTLFKHILPNCLAPVIVMATTSLGIYIVAEATLSYLGIGLPTTVVSWGNDISTAQKVLRQAPANLFYPSAALALTVLGYILMGDCLKDALDPKERRK